LHLKQFSLQKAGRWVWRTYAPDSTFNPAPTLSARMVAFVRRIWSEWDIPTAMDMSAKVCFYFSLSCFPFLLVLAALLGWIHRSSNWISFWYWLTNNLPTNAQDTVLLIMRDLSNGFRGYLSFGLLLAVWSASTGFLSLMDALTAIYGAKETRSYVQRRLVAITATFVAAVFLLACFGIWSTGHLAAAFFLRYTVHFDWQWKVVRWMVTLAMIWLGVDLMNYFLPAKRPPWRWVMPGSALTVTCFVVASALLKLYVRHDPDISRIYGTLTGFILMMLWIYLANLSLLLGAQTDAALTELKAGRSGP
jgi:membrane protein